MLLKLFNALNQQQQPVNTGRYNFQYGAHSELSKSLNVPDGRQSNGIQKPGNLNLQDGTQLNSSNARFHSQNIDDQQHTENQLSLQVSNILFRSVTDGYNGQQHLAVFGCKDYMMAQPHLLEFETLKIRTKSTCWKVQITIINL